MIVDFVLPLTRDNATGTVAIPYQFTAEAVNRCVWVAIASCHPSNGLSADPVLDCLQDGVQMYGYRQAESTPGEGGLPPVRDYLFLSSPSMATPTSGVVTIPLRPGVPTHLVVHVVGLKGGVSPWKRDDERDTAGTGSVTCEPLLFADPYGGFMSASARGNPTPPTLSAGSGAIEQLGDATAGAPGMGSVRGTVWRCGTSSSWTVNSSDSSANTCATAFSFSGGAVEHAPSEPVRIMGAISRAVRLAGSWISSVAGASFTRAVAIQRVRRQPVLLTLWDDMIDDMVIPGSPIEHVVGRCVSGPWSADTTLRNSGRSVALSPRTGRAWMHRLVAERSIGPKKSTVEMNR